MEYSAVTAPLSLGKILFTTPHLLIGVAALVMSVKKGKSPVLAVMALVFVAFISYVWISDATETVQCYQAAAGNTGTTVKGKVTDVKQLFSRSGEGWVRFSVDGTSVVTRTAGLNHDCGFIESLGRLYRPKPGQNIEILLYRERPVRARLIDDA